MLLFIKSNFYKKWFVYPYFSLSKCFASKAALFCLSCICVLFNFYICDFALVINVIIYTFEVKHRKIHIFVQKSVSLICHLYFLSVYLIKTKLLININLMIKQLYSNITTGKKFRIIFCISKSSLNSSERRCIVKQQMFSVLCITITIKAETVASLA